MRPPRGRRCLLRHPYLRSLSLLLLLRLRDGQELSVCLAMTGLAGLAEDTLDSARMGTGKGIRCRVVAREQVIVGCVAAGRE